MSLLNGYKITEKVYESNNSEIYRAQRQSDKQLVIMKMLKESHPSPERVARFKREYELTRGLDVKGVIKVYSLEEEQYRWFITLEDFGGKSLTQLNLAGQLDVATFLRLAIAVSDILGELHQQQLIHKDINPANIIYNPTTQEVKLIDFGISTVLSRENTTFRNPNVLEGTLAYISPEQTGRMNRGIDYRTDFYSLGVTFYELLTGQLPFTSQDPLELIHHHIAIQPIPPHEWVDIPPIVSQIILKLMTKNAEARYQSAHGLKLDLENCLRQWVELGEIKPFPLADHDRSDRFQIPQKLYGRTTEFEILLAGFERVAQGTKEITLVTGYSGVGKSALVQEVYKPLTAKKGYFIAGKFDQYQRNIPYSAWIQAFQNLIKQLLTETETQIATWREKLLTALAPNGQIIIDIIPEVALIIGSQPPIPELGAVESQNRFNLIFQKFIQVFLQVEHPLVLFLDDLQWGDEASLKLFELLLTSSEIQYLYLIGAYRDNEVGAGHPLLLTLKEIEQKGGTINAISLAPLNFTQVNDFIADTLHQSLEQMESLVTLVHQKTGGNPFFLTEFLKSLYTLKLINFDHVQGIWQWDLSQIQAQEMTNNVVDLMTHKIQRLPEQTQQVLKLAACFGNQFDLSTLAVIYEQSAHQTAQDLWLAIVEGVILPLSDNYKLLEQDIAGLADTLTVTYKFAHDRIQQAAYSLISDSDKQRTHWQIGQLLLTNLSIDEQHERIFDIVNQLNQGHVFAKNEADYQTLTRLNLEAGKKAKQANAYRTALTYLDLVLEGLKTKTWDTDYDLFFEAYKEQSEIAFLAGDFPKADQLMTEALSKISSKFDKSQIYKIKLARLAFEARYADAGATVIEALNLFGLGIPALDQKEALQAATGAEMALYAENMKGRSLESLWDLPIIQDKAMEIVTQMIGTSLDSIIIGIPDLFPFFTAKMVNLSLTYGVSDFTAIGYVYWGFILTYQDYGQAYRFSAMAIKLIEEKLPNPSLLSKVYHIHAHTCVIREPLAAGQDYHKRAYRVGLDAGDLVYAAYAYSGEVKFTIPFNVMESTIKGTQVISFMRQVKNFVMVSYVGVTLGFCKSLQGSTLYSDRFDFDDWTEQGYIELFGSPASFMTAHYKNYKLQSLVIFERCQEAIQIIQERATWIAIGGGDTFYKRDFCFFTGLTVSNLYSNASKEEQNNYLDILSEMIAIFKNFLEHGTEDNFQHSYLLLEAEKARLENRPIEAMQLYQQAIQSAQKYQYGHVESLANERAAHFYFAQGLDRVALDYMREAHYAYQRWGATAKAKQLAEKYPKIIDKPSKSTSSHTIMRTTGTPSTTDTTSSGQLDLTTVVKASQAISGEIVLSKLLEKMMRIAVENAGAQRGLLVLLKDKRWVVQAKLEVATQKVELLQAIPIETIGGYSNEPELSVSITNYVIRTQQSLVLNDAANNEQFARSQYISQKRPKSVLCMPLLNQGRVSGILYLENNLTTGAFTSDRLALLEMLGSQIAISLDNAVLYEDLKQYQDHLQELVDSRTRRLELVAALGERLNTILDTDQLLMGVVNGVKDNFNYYHAHIYLRDDTKAWLVMSAGTGEAGSVMKQRGHRIAADAPTSLVARAARSGEVVSVENVREDPAWLPNPLLPETRCEMAIPIIVENKVVGVLDVQSEHVAGLDEGDANLLRSLASQVGVALTNSKLFGRVQRRNEQIEEANQELQQTLQQLQATQEQLIESEKMASLGGLVAGVAHEINTPLGIGFTAATTLENKTKDVAELYEQNQLKGSALKAYFQTALNSTHLISNNLQRAGDLIQSFKQVAVDQSNLEQRTFNVKSYIDDTLINLNPKLRQTSQEIVVEGSDEVELKSYPGAFSQIVTNLVMNSLVHAYHRDDKGLMKFVINKVDDRVIVEYSDDGAGIAPQNLSKIFEPFFTTKRNMGGTGLGLHIVYNLVTQKLGGTIRCESTLGQGTKFTLNLPLVLKKKD